MKNSHGYVVLNEARDHGEGLTAVSVLRTVSGGLSTSSTKAHLILVPFLFPHRFVPSVLQTVQGPHDLFLSCTPHVCFGSDVRAGDHMVHEIRYIGSHWQWGDR